MFKNVLFAIACLVLLFMFGTTISNGIHDWRVDAITQTELLETDISETTGTVTLDRDPLNNSVNEISSITSSLSETPIVESYTTSTNALLLSNLTENDNRTLTIVYSAQKEDTMMQALGPFLSFLVFGSILACIGIGLFMNKGRRK